VSFWKSLFGGPPAAGEPMAAETVEYKGFTIVAAPFQDRGRWMTAGTISKVAADETWTHRFVRADSHATFEQAAAFSLDKGRQIVDLQGERVFDS
jgi:hypothetical protein